MGDDATRIAAALDDRCVTGRRSLSAPVRAFVQLVLLAAFVAICSARALPAQALTSSDYLYLWSGSADSTQPDFLAVLDVRPIASGYGKLVATVPVPGRRNIPHHIEHEMSAHGRLFANGVGSGRSFVFDVHDPARVRVERQFGDVAGLMHPHSFLRLPNGNVLATFQMQHDSLGVAPGGLVELTKEGTLVRSSTADLSGVDRRIRPYSAAIVPRLDRIVTTTNDMMGEEPVRAVQLWRLSDLKLLRTFDLPHGPHSDEAAFTAEPRLLADGRTVLVSTFNCGLYLLHGLDAGEPSGALVASFPQLAQSSCGIPVIAAHYYLVSVPAWHAVVSLDVSDPSHPREVSRLVLGPTDVPHWISLEPNHQRVVITGYGSLERRVVMASFDERTGRLALDPRFRDAGATEPGVRMEGKSWPHGGRGAAIPHGAVFSYVAPLQPSP